MSPSSDAEAEGVFCGASSQMSFSLVVVIAFFGAYLANDLPISISMAKALELQQQSC